MKTFIAKPASPEHVEEVQSELNGMLIHTTERFVLNQTIAAGGYANIVREVTVPNGYGLLGIAGVYCYGGTEANIAIPTFWAVASETSVRLFFVNDTGQSYHASGRSITFNVQLDLVFIKSAFRNT